MRSILARVAARHGRTLRLSPEALRDLLAHDWPGNVRELENALEYAVAICHGQTILPEDLPTLVPLGAAVRRRTAAGRRPMPWRRSPGPAGAARRDIAQARRRARPKSCAARSRTTAGGAAEAARALGISRTTLWRRMRELGLAS